MVQNKSQKASKGAVATKVTVATKKSRFGNGELVPGALFAELVGVFILTAIALNTGGNVIVVAVAVIILVLALGKLSGGHINPAVTIGLLTVRKISPVRAGGYLVAQLLGAMLALVVVTQFAQTGTASELTGQAPQVFEAAIMSGEWRLFFAEALGGLLFGFGIGAAVLTRRENWESAFIIGGSLLLGLVVATLGSAAILNPAIALGVSAYHLDNLWSLLAYAVGPLSGVAVGIWVYKLLQRDTAEKESA